MVPPLKLFSLFALCFFKTSVESVDASTGINKLLLAGEERVTIGANVNTDVLLGGAGFISCATGTLYDGSTVCGMNSFLHSFHLFISCADAKVPHVLPGYSITLQSEMQ